MIGPLCAKPHTQRARSPKFGSRSGPQRCCKPFSTLVWAARPILPITIRKRIIKRTHNLPEGFMIHAAYHKTIARWRSQGATEGTPPAVTIIQWLLVTAPVLLALTSYEFQSYAVLAFITQALVVLNVLLLIIVTREVLKTRTIGKFCLIGGTFIFYWLDALALSSMKDPFSIAEGFPINATQFDQE